MIGVSLNWLRFIPSSCRATSRTSCSIRTRVARVIEGSSRASMGRIRARRGAEKPRVVSRTNRLGRWWLR